MKTVGFKAPKYVGDPINAVKIFNEKEADELIVLDIDATANGAEPDYQMIRHLAIECRMPLCYGGGVKTAEQASRIVALGVEKVAISAAAVARPGLVGEISEQIGRQSVAVVIDYRKKMLGRGLEVWTHNGTHNARRDALEFAQEMAERGAGEIVLNSIEQDGKMDGYDLAAAAKLRASVHVPITILGGAGALDHMHALFEACGVVGAAAGSFFVFKGPYKAVLITYPNLAQKDALIDVR